MPHSRQTQQIQYYDIQPPLLPDPLFTNFAESCEHKWARHSFHIPVEPHTKRNLVFLAASHRHGRCALYRDANIPKFQAANDESLRVYMRTHAVQRRRD
jgi:hypothetical protein